MNIITWKPPSTCCMTKRESKKRTIHKRKTKASWSKTVVMFLSWTCYIKWTADVYKGTKSLVKEKITAHFAWHCQQGYIWILISCWVPIKAMIYLATFSHLPQHRYITTQYCVGCKAAFNEIFKLQMWVLKGLTV